MPDSFLKEKFLFCSRIYRTNAAEMDYDNVLGTYVKGTIDRPLGSTHPKYSDIIYPINYGYVDGVFACDGDEQDVYVFGSNQPLKTFAGKVVGVYHRLNDNEDKWIVSINGDKLSADDILKAIAFQEQYFMGELYLWKEQNDKPNQISKSNSLH